MAAYERARAWQELFALVTKEKLVSGEELGEMGKRVGEDLVSRKRYFEAGRVLLEYAKDVPEAVSAFVQGNEIAEADRVCAMTDRLELVESILHPGVLELRELIGEDIREMMDQLTKQTDRLKELREKKSADPDAFYGLDEPQNLQDVDAMTDAASTVGTTFTRYTVAPSTAAGSKKSKATAKSRQKAARKKGRKGTIEEETYILESVAKIPSRLEDVKSQVAKLLPYLANFTEGHRVEGAGLQKEVEEAEKSLKRAIEEAWATTEEEEDGDGVSGLSNPAFAKSAKVPRPALSWTSDWKVVLLETA